MLFMNEAMSSLHVYCFLDSEVQCGCDEVAVKVHVGGMPNGSVNNNNNDNNTPPLRSSEMDLGQITDAGKILSLYTIQFDRSPRRDLGIIAPMPVP